MELFQVELTGFKKFREKTTLKARGKLLAILGPNEAGKSSLLKALKRLDDEAGFQPTERSTGAGNKVPNIKVTYLLSQEDREAVGLTIGTWYDVAKSATGKLTWSIRPTPPDRDYKHRPKLIKQVGTLPKSVQAFLVENDENLLGDTTKLLARIFVNEVELSDEAKPQLSELLSRWQSLATSEAPPKVRRISDDLAEAVRLETAQSRGLVAGNALRSRMPEFLFFGADERDLQSV